MSSMKVIRNMLKSLLDNIDAGNSKLNTLIINSEL